MFFWTISWVLISLILILLVHNIFIYFKDTLTVPKTRDLISKHDSRYNELVETSNNIQTDTNNVDTNNVDTNNVDTNNVDTNNTENELKDYLKEINTNNSVTEIDSIINLNSAD